MWRASGNFCIPARSSIIFTGTPGRDLTRTKRNWPRALAKFPDADPSRPFAPKQVHATPYSTPPAQIPGTCWIWIAQTASKRRLFRGQSFWERLLEIAGEENPAYQKYSYSRRADLYRLDLDAENGSRIEEAANRLASGKLRSALRVLPSAACILFVCPR